MMRVGWARDSAEANRAVDRSESKFCRTDAEKTIPDMLESLLVSSSHFLTLRIATGQNLMYAATLSRRNADRGVRFLKMPAKALEMRDLAVRVVQARGVWRIDPHVLIYDDDYFGWNFVIAYERPELLGQGAIERITIWVDAVAVRKPAYTTEMALGIQWSPGRVDLFRYKSGSWQLALEQYARFGTAPMP
jgi:hypothetical protein